MGGRSPDGFWNASAYPTNSEDDAAFEQSVKDSLRDMIRINRNHPSIVAWSMCNEVFFSEKSVLPKVRNFLTELVAETHELDPTRPAGIGGCQRGGLDKLGDIAGYNGDGARLYIDPGIPNLVTEYSSVRAVRPGKYGRLGEIFSRVRATGHSRFSGVIRGAAARCCGACSTTAASPATRARPESLIISGCQNARGIGIGMNTPTFRRRNGRRTARLPG
jgi:hypothetical protein